jgi:biotin carboxyl carrier protein
VRFVVSRDGREEEAEVQATPGDGSRYRVRLGQEWIEVEAGPAGPGALAFLVEGASFVADVTEDAGETQVTIGGRVHPVRVEPPGRRGRAGRGGRAPGQRLVAPMPGRVVAVPVRPGQRVEPGTPLVVLEAMKMENEFRAAAAGVVAEVGVAPGQAVNAGDLLVVVAPG